MILLKPRGCCERGGALDRVGVPKESIALEEFCPWKFQVHMPGLPFHCPALNPTAEDIPLLSDSSHRRDLSASIAPRCRSCSRRQSPAVDVVVVLSSCKWCPSRRWRHACCLRRWDGVTEFIAKRLGGGVGALRGSAFRSSETLVLWTMSSHVGHLKLHCCW